jgi:isopentenyl-diphosphate delta-isomerase
MTKPSEIITQRKREHISLCLTDNVSFKEKTNGFNYYEFKHYAITEVERNKIDFSTDFFTKKINYPFLISCMTGGTPEAENINNGLAEAANELNIPLGIGSQRHAIGNEVFNKSYKILRKKAPNIPILGNIGAAQIAKNKNVKEILNLADLIEANAMVVHLNSLQELFQDNGEPNFSGLFRNLEKIIKEIEIPVVAKEVGAGISGKVAKKLLSIGIKGIDVAGAGGTSWSGVELLRNGSNSENYFWEWGLPTSYCLKKVSRLKKNYSFMLIGSGGINNAVDAAKAFALGADITASARAILQVFYKSGQEGVIETIKNWFNIVKDIMFLTGSNNIFELQKNKIIRKDKLY